MKYTGVMEFIEGPWDGIKIRLTEGIPFPCEVALSSPVFKDEQSSVVTATVTHKYRCDYCQPVGKRDVGFYMYSAVTSVKEGG